MAVFRGGKFDKICIFTIENYCLPKIEYVMSDIYHIRAKKDYAVSLLELLRRDDAIEDLEFQEYESFEKRHDTLNIKNRLKELSLLQNGWLNGEGAAPKKENLDWLLGAFENYYNSTLPAPYLYPTVDGGIQAEWTNGRHDVSLNIDLKTKKAFYQELNHDTDATEETTLLLNRDEDWKLLNNKLLSIQ
jgi:hypothetical protein